MEFLMKLFDFLRRYLKLLWSFWCDFWGPVDSSVGSKVDVWFERQPIVQFVNKYAWIFLGAIAVFVATITVLVFAGVMPSGIGQDNLLDYICAGLFLSWAIVEWVMDAVRHLLDSGDIVSQARYGSFIIILGFIVLFGKEILASGKKIFFFVGDLFKKFRERKILSFVKSLFKKFFKREM